MAPLSSEEEATACSRESWDVYSYEKSFLKNLKDNKIYISRWPSNDCVCLVDSVLSVENKNGKLSCSALSSLRLIVLQEKDMVAG